mmetsp:Transcript_15725/g.46400  ORF Transcript_15725/g.46400 Transcript_15725/m.46400 type:complete len:226 (-) Transcript_15725:18-695(-)
MPRLPNNARSARDHNLGLEEGRARQRRHGAVEVRRRPEARRTDHRQAPVVRLGLALRLELVGRQARREADGVPDGQLLGAAAGHVVRLLELGPELDEAGREEDLDHAAVVAEDGLGGQAAGHVAELVARHVVGAGPAEAHLGHDPARAGRHGHAAVLRLGRLEPGLRPVRAELAQARGVPEAERRRRALRGAEPRRRPRGGRRDERAGDARERDEPVHPGTHRAI